MRITCLSRDAGYWSARVTVDGKTYAVDRRYGSWRLTPSEGAGGYQVVLPGAAMALQARVRREERRAERITT